MRRSDQPSDRPLNRLSGDVTGASVQARTIEGGVHLHASAVSAVTLPHRAGVMPPRAGSFQERLTTRTLFSSDKLRANHAPPADNLTFSNVLSGLGGVGKTQLAVDYAEAAWRAGTVDLLVWVTAGSREAIMSAYARLARELTGIEDGSTEQGTQRLLAWLATTTRRWLVVLDDVQSPNDVRALWPPVTDTGQVLVTTRRRDAALRGHKRRMIEVGMFTEDESKAYLLAALDEHPHLIDGAAELANDLGHLPLALAQAAAYMVDRDLSCREYRQRFSDRRRTLESLLPAAAELPDEHRATVAATWSLSIEQANSLTPQGLAHPLIEVASVLDANGIPFEVFTSNAVLSLLADFRRATEEDARDALGCLQRLSLVSLTSEPERTVRVHALVQRATRDRMTDNRTALIVRVAADALLERWPTVERNTTIGEVLRTNATALYAVGEKHLWDAAGHPLAFRVGHSFGRSGSVKIATEWFEQMAASASSHLGPHHPDSLKFRERWALWYAKTGDVAGSANMFEQLEADLLGALGPAHPQTLVTQIYLNFVRGEQGRPSEAAHELGTTVRKLVQVLGPDHPEVLEGRHNHAYMLGASGDPAAAVAAIGDLVADRTRLMGADHPDTLNTRGLLARLIADLGDPLLPIAAMEELLADRTRVLGSESPATLMTRSHLARQRGEAGHPAAAVEEFEVLLADRERVLGPDHPHTLDTREDLAVWRYALGDVATAVADAEALLVDRSRILGSHHRATMMTKALLARWRGEAGDTTEALTALVAILADMVEHLEPEHPIVRRIRTDIVRFRASGDGSPTES